MFHENKEDVMTAPGFCSNGSSCWHMFGSSARGKKPASHVNHLYWLHILLLVILLAGQVSCNQTSTTPSSVSFDTTNEPTLVHYFLDVTVLGEEIDESAVAAWLRLVFQDILPVCVPQTTAVPTTLQTDSTSTMMITTTTQNFLTTTSGSTATSARTSTAATSEATQQTSTSTAATTTTQATIATTILQDTSTTILTTAQNTSTTAATTTEQATSITTAEASESSTIRNVMTTLTTESSTTAAPTTESFTTAAPTTESFITAAPTTESFTTAAPTTKSSTTAAPTTESFTTAAPTTESFTTAAPTTKSSTTAAPTTESFTTAAPTTESSTTAAPTTESSTTAAPTTESFTTAAPTTESSTTAAPTTESSTTAAPTTESFTTAALTTKGSTTAAPTTESSTTTEATTMTKSSTAMIPTTTTSTKRSTTMTDTTTTTDPLPSTDGIFGGGATPNSNSNSMQSNRLRVAREVNSGSTQTRTGETTGILHTLDVSCSENNTIRNTNCSVMMSLRQRVPPCCVLHTLCQVSQHFFEINAVWKRIDIINPLHDQCDINPEEENSCIYIGGANESCEEALFIVPNSNPENCSTEEVNSTCSCSAYCRGSNAYYAFEISVQDPEITFADVSSRLNEPPSCSPSTDPSCPPLSIASHLENQILSCENTAHNLQTCRVILNFTREVPICSVSAAMENVFQNKSQISITRPVTRAAICGSSEESQLSWRTSNLEPALFCTAFGSSGLECENGESLLVLLKQQCDGQFTTPGPNVTTTQPNTTMTVETTQPSMNTTQTPMNMTTTQFPMNTTQTPMNMTTTQFPMNMTTTQTTTNMTTTQTPMNMTTTQSHMNMTTTQSHMNMTSTQSPLNTTISVTATTLNPTTTTVNVEGQADALLELTRNVSNLNSSQVNQLVSQLESLLSGPNVSFALGNTSVQIVSNLLSAAPEAVSESSSRIIGIVDTVALRLVLENMDQTILAQDLAVAVSPADGNNFAESTFSITDPDNVQLNGGSRRRRSVRVDSSIPQGSIRLPAALTQNLSSEEQQLASRVQFNFYQRSTVFQDVSLGDRILNSGILGASVANLSISDLQELIIITLRHTEPIPANFAAACVFWNFSLNNGSGGWSGDGCFVQSSNDNETVCGCTHLTSFAILLDLSRTQITDPVQAIILTFITYIGCGVSAIFLSITLLTYLAFGKLRKDIPSKILIQLCFALLLLNLVFLIDSWLALYPDAVGLCISTAWFLHYFLLVAFTWMGLEAVHMYLALVKVFNTYISHYMLKFSLVGWGVPMIVVIIVIAIDKDNYGLVTYGRFTDGSTDDFCWLKNDIAFYVAVVAYFCVIFVFNLIMFVVVLVQLCRIKRQNPHNTRHRTTLQDMRSVAGITILLGLTWGFAFFAWGPVNLAFMYLFAIFNSLQGFFIFVFHCAVKESVRKQWRMYLCCGKMRLAENSDWSRTYTQKTVKKSSMNRVISKRSSKLSQSNSSSSFLVSDSSDHINGISSPFNDRAITADEELNSDVVLNEINRQNRHHAHAS